jgi:hypothetical protein
MGRELCSIRTIVRHLNGVFATGTFGFTVPSTGSSVEDRRHYEN